MKKILEGFDLSYLTNLARKAGGIITSNFKLGMDREWKLDDSLLTQTDTAINQMVIEVITRDFPMVRVIGEEDSSDNLVGNEWVVMCDPVDGTAAFGTGIPTCCFCISLLRDGQPVLACIYDPFQDRMYTAQIGKGSHLNGKSIHVSEKPSIKHAFIGVVFWKGCSFNTWDIAAEVMERGATLMGPLSIAYWAALVAAGEIDATVFPGKTTWETSAIKLLVEEAGGKVTDIFGDDHGRLDGEMKGHLVSNGLIHDELVTIAREINL